MNFTKLPVTIKECTQEDLNILEKELPSGFSRFHEKYFADQVAEKATYLIAWYNKKPIGKLLINWEGCQYPEVKRYIINCPTFIGIETKKDMRNKGVASQIIEFAESRVRAKMFNTVGLEIALQNTDAKKLYERLGYTEWNHGIFIDTWIETIDKVGTKAVHEDPSTFYLKVL